MDLRTLERASLPPSPSLPPPSLFPGQDGAIRQLSTRVNIMNRRGRSISERARVLARRKDVPSLQTYFRSLVDNTLGFGNNPAAAGRGRDPSLRWVRYLSGSRRTRPKQSGTR